MSTHVHGTLGLIALAVASLAACDDEGDAGAHGVPDAGADAGGGGIGGGDGGGDAAPEETCVPEQPLADGACERSTACPGAPGCESGAGGFQAGFAAVDVTPGFELPAEGTMDDGRWTGYRFDAATFRDCGRDQRCPGDPGYEAPDADGSEGDGAFQGAWLAGFGAQRPAVGVHDPVWARCAVFGAGDTRVALAAVDAVGLFRDEVVRMRERLDPALGVDLLVVGSTHDHEAPDTLGQWGPDDGTGVPAGSGRDPVTQEGVRAGVVRCVEQAVVAMRPAELTALVARTGVAGLIRDSRDPVVIDDELPVLRADDAETGETLGTVLSWGSHPEALSGGNTLVTSDFPHWIRQTVEQGLEPLGDHPGIDGLGGTCVYFSGAVGGLTTPLGITAVDRDGTEVGAASFDKARVIGERVGLTALEALAAADPPAGGGGGPEPEIAFGTQTFLLPVENRLFHVLMFATFEPRIFDRGVYDFDQYDTVMRGNFPHVLTEVDVVRIGPATVFTLPGEVFPELVVGFGEEWSHGLDRVHADNPNPPDLSMAPSEPPLKRVMPGDVPFLIGLGNDELGYMVPPYDFELAEFEWVVQAPGDHYEETNSIGAAFVPVVEAHVRDLAAALGGP